MGVYSIKELERLSGIRAHTIRIWEKRHGLIRPERTRSGVRVYSDEDLKAIINIAMLNGHGIKISAIAGMSGEEMKEKVIELSESSRHSGIHIDQLITSMLDFDENKFQAEIAAAEKSLGFETTVTDVIYPFLDKIGILWQTGSISPAHEHFISNLIRQNLIVATASLPVPKSALRAVLFLPENELHEIGLLFYNYITRKSGVKTYYLGQSVPLADLRAVCSIHRPHLVVTSFTSSPPVTELNEYLKRLCAGISSTRVLASGPMLRKVSFSFPSNFKAFHTAAELRDILTKK